MGLSIEEQRQVIRDKKKRELKKGVQKETKNKQMHQRKYQVEYLLVKGIYFLHHKGELVYIGQSKSNVMQRICDHFKDTSKLFDSFNIKIKDELSDKQLDQLEKNLIKKFKPKYNIVYNSGEQVASKKIQSSDDINFKSTENARAIRRLKRETTKK